MKRPNRDISLDFDLEEDLYTDHDPTTDLPESFNGEPCEAFKVYFNKLLLACSDENERDVLRDCERVLYRHFHHFMF